MKWRRSARTWSEREKMSFDSAGRWGSWEEMVSMIVDGAAATAAEPLLQF